MNLRFSRKLALKLTQVILFAAIYFATAKLGLMLATLPGNVSAVWPPSGINLAVLLLLGYKVWPGIALGSLISVLEDLLKMQPPLSGITCIAIASCFAIGNSLETLSATFLTRKWCGTSIPLYRAEDVLKFVAVEGLISRPLCATICVTTLCISGLAPWTSYGSIWWTWWTSGLVAALVFTPTILTWSRTISSWKNRSLTEGFLLLVLLFGVGYISFGGGYPVVFMFLPILVWSAFRFGPKGATLSILIVSGIAIWGTVRGYGSFVSNNPTESLVLLQSFIGVIALTTLVLSGVITEREQAQKALKNTLEQLELRVEERTIALSLANECLQEQATKLEFALKELQRTQAQLIQTEKMSSLGQLVAGIAHEINNPINFIYGNLEYAKQYSQKLIYLLEVYQQHYPHPKLEVQQEVENMELDYILEDLPKLLYSMKMGTERIRQTVVSLRNFSRLDEAEMKQVDIHEGIDSALMILQHRLKENAGKSAINTIKEYGKLPQIECYVGQLNQVFMNIITNAIDALEEAGKSNLLSGVKSVPPTIWIHTGVIDSSGDRIYVQIKDNGPGMTEEAKKQLFNPFFSTKPVGKGTGLGLAISYQIVVEKHKGKLKCYSHPGEGTELTIEIPVRQYKCK